MELTINFPDTLPDLLQETVDNKPGLFYYL